MFKRAPSSCVEKSGNFKQGPHRYQLANITHIVFGYAHLADGYQFMSIILCGRLERRSIKGFLEVTDGTEADDTHLAQLCRGNQSSGIPKGHHPWQLPPASFCVSSPTDLVCLAAVAHPRQGCSTSSPPRLHTSVHVNGTASAQHTLGIPTLPPR